MIKKILIVDDEPTLVEILTDHFTNDGWTVESACNGKDGFEKTKSFSPDVILSDILMPVMTGLQMLEALYLIKSDIPLIFLSGFKDAEKTKLAWSMYAFDFLDKPFNSTSMLLVAQNAFEYGKDYVQNARKKAESLKKQA